MISRRQRSASETIEILVFWESAQRAIAAEHKISKNDIRVLMAGHYMQCRTNQFLTVNDLLHMTGLKAEDIFSSLKTLVPGGFIDKVDEKYNLSVKGEYVIRGISLSITRHMKGYTLPKWSRVKISDVRRKYLRPNAVRDSVLYP